MWEIVSVRRTEATTDFGLALDTRLYKLNVRNEKRIEKKTKKKHIIVLNSNVYIFDFSERHDGRVHFNYTLKSDNRRNN